MKIAVYAPALDEAANVRDWAKACAGADVRVIADTGSTDDTVKLARSNGVKVQRISVIPWRFDIARNAALALVPADVDVCLILDLDERPNPEMFDAIRDLWTPETTRGWVDIDTGHVWRADRLHARHGYRWINPCHEIAVPYHGRLEVHQTIPGIIRHRQLPKDRSNYVALLDLAVREAPQDGRMWTYLVREHFYLRDWARVLQTAQEALLRAVYAPERAAVCQWAAVATEALQGDPEGWLRMGIAENPREWEPHLALARLFYLREDWAQLAAVTEHAIEESDIGPTTHYLRDSDAEWLMHDYDALASYHLGRPDRAVRSGQRAIDLCPSEKRLHENMAFYLDSADRVNLTREIA